MAFKYMLALVLASFAFVGCATSRCERCKTIQWEYKVVFLSYSDLKNSANEGNVPKNFDQFYQDEQQQLNEIGKEGWKLVSADQSGMIFIFERPKH